MGFLQGMGKALSAPLRLGGKFNPMNSNNKFINPLNIGGVGQKLGITPMQGAPPSMASMGAPKQPGGIGPSMAGWGGMMSQMAEQQQPNGYGEKPQPMPPEQGPAPEMGGVGPTDNVVQSAMQQMGQPRQLGQPKQGVNKKYML